MLSLAKLAGLATAVAVLVAAPLSVHLSAASLSMNAAHAADVSDIRKENHVSPNDRLNPNDRPSHKVVKEIKKEHHVSPKDRKNPNDRPK